MLTKGKRRRNRKTRKQGGGIDHRFLDCHQANLERIETAIRETSGTHAIDHALAEQFIAAQTTLIRRQAARDLVENTIYITLRETDAIIHQLVDQFFANPAILEFYARPGDHTIYVYTGGIQKSNYFLAVLAYKYIRHYTTNVMFVTEILFEKIGTNPLLILDDVSYTGSQLSSLLHHIYWGEVAVKGDVVKDEFDMSTEKMISEKTPPSIFILLTALNDVSLSQLSKVPTVKTTMWGPSYFSEFKASPFQLMYLKERLYTPLLYKLGIERYIRMTFLFSPITSPKFVPFVSIYLDHKMADPASTFTTALMYGPIIPNGMFRYNGVDEFIVDEFANRAGIHNYDPTIVQGLVDTYNMEHGTSMTKHKKIFEHALEKLVKDDSESPYALNFIPFLNTCKDDPVLVANCQDAKIKQMDYFVFMLPKGCLEGNCSVDVPDYIEEYYGDDYDGTEKAQLVALHKQVNSYRCPQSWYKNGRLQMSC